MTQNQRPPFDVSPVTFACLAYLWLCAMGRKP